MRGESKRKTDKNPSSRFSGLLSLRMQWVIVHYYEGIEKMPLEALAARG